ncbi:MAG: hypothetical protein AAGF56_06700 [Pseudomonadota bacterium]
MGKIVINLSPELHDAVHHLAGRDGQAISRIFQIALRNDLRRRLQARNQRISELLRPHRSAVADDFGQATDWSDLQHRLAKKGYTLIKKGGGLSLSRAAGGQICNTADLGYSHAQLTRRFSRPFPPILMKVPASLTDE